MGLDMTCHKIWKDKNIKPECKKIYAYLYSQALDKEITHVNTRNIQHIISITNKGFKKNLDILEKFKYLIYKEYDRGLYEVKVY